VGAAVRLPRHLGLILGFFGIVYMVWLFQAWLPGYLEIQRHMSIRTTGFVAAIPYACGVVGSIGAGWVTDRLMAGGFSPINSRKLPIIVGLVAMAVFTFVAAETPNNVVAVMAISAAVFFAGGASGMSWALASVAAPAHCTASLGSIQNFGGYLGGALAPTVTGFIVQATGTFVPALLVGAVIALASAATGAKGEQNKANAHRRQTDLTQNAGRNASVDKVTLDVISPDRTIYDRVRESGVLSRAAVCRIFGIAATQITDHVEFDPALAIKFPIDRLMPSGSPGDTDVFGSQQYGPLLHIDVPGG
jgi:MFS family permease